MKIPLNPPQSCENKKLPVAVQWPALFQCFNPATGPTRRIIPSDKSRHIVSPSSDRANIFDRSKLKASQANTIPFRPLLIPDLDLK